MTEQKLLRIHISALRRIEGKLRDIDRKLEHIIFRMRDDDPRIQKGEKDV